MRPSAHVISVIATLAFAAAPALAQEGPDAPPPVVVVASATAERMAETVTVPGSVVSRSDSEIAAEVSGVVDWVAEIGASVEAGGTIARVGGELLQIEAKRAEASVKRLEARVAFLDDEVARQEELSRKGSASRQKLEQARSERDQARQDLAEARLMLERAQYDLAHAEVKSPFPGRIVTRLIEPGEFLNRGSAVARVVDVSALEVTAQIPISSVAQIKEGDQVTVEGPGGEVVGAKVRALVPVGDEVSRSAELRATLEAGVWLVGMAVKVATPTAPPRDVIAVPRDAVLLRAEGAAVFRIGADGTAELVQVRTGLTSGGLVAVEGGLAAGDRVVVRGGETLQPGQKVQIQAENATDASAGTGAG